jgi:iron complex outermembrane receptor protein
MEGDFEMHDLVATGPASLLGLRSSSIALACGLAIVATPAWAQDDTAGQASADEPAISEIVVTAQFREQSLQDTPLAITAINSEMLEARSQTNVAEIAAQAPNVTLRPLGGSFGPSMGASIRGIGQYDFNPALEPGVGIYVDDVYYSSLTGAQFDLLDLERVEILRGPQGTLFGKNSIGGAIRLISRKPEGDGSGYISATYGSRDRLDFRGSVDFALIPDRLFARISGVSRSQDGYVDVVDFQCANPGSTPALPIEGTSDDCIIGSEGGTSYKAVKGIFRFIASDNVELTLAADYTHDDSEGPAVTLLSTNVGGVQDGGVPYDNRFIPDDPYVSYGTFAIRGGVYPGYDGWAAENRSKYEGWGGSLTADFRLSDNLAIKSITGYREFDTYWSGDPDVSPLSLILSEESLTNWQVSQELRLTGQLFDDLLDFTVGGYYFDARTTYANRVSFPYIGVPGYDFLGDDPVDSTTKAVFAHFELHPTDRLTITAGVRYTDDKKVYHYTRTNPDGSANPAVGNLNGESGAYAEDRFDYRIGADYDVTDDIMIYAQRSTGFKGGGVNPRPYLPSQVQPFDSETVTANEVGIKTQFADRRVRLNLAAFYNKYKDIQLTALSCPQFNPPGFPATFPCAVPQNAGNATIQGIELETDIRPVDGLMFDGAVSYIDAHYTFVDPVAQGANGPFADDVLGNTPKWKASAGLQYEIPLGNGSITPRVDMSYRSDFYTGSTNTARSLIEGYTLLNARLTYRNDPGKWDLSLEVQNLTDKFYLVTIVDPGAFRWAQPSRPREWAVTLRKKF